MLYRLSYVGIKHQTVLNSILMYCLIMERVVGIEPTLSAWKAEVLPLNYTRLITTLYYTGGGGRIRTFEG